MKYGLFFALLFTLSACDTRRGQGEHHLDGYAQGSTFHISYLAPPELDMEADVDSILRGIDASLSTYQENSLISRLNRGDTLQPDAFLRAMLRQSDKVYRQTRGAFDPTIGKLVRFWGFGPEKRRDADSSAVDSLLASVGYERLQWKQDPLSLPPGLELDFNAIAQGYSVDVIAEHFDEQGIADYMIEVGGELRTRGKNADGEIWRIGVDKPTEKINQQDRFQFIIALDSAGLATSGNYRKFWVDEETGMRYAHTIDPRSGFPARNRLLSATVIASTSAMADAYATAFMVWGYERSVKFIEEEAPELEVYFIMGAEEEDDTWEIYQSPGLSEMILN